MKRSIWKKILLFVAALFVFLYIVAPFSWVVITSLMSETEASSVPPHWIPDNPTLKNYALFVTGGKGGEAAKTSDAWSPQSVKRLPVAFRNSSIVAISVALLNLSMGAPAAYALARLRFRGSNLMLMGYLFSRMLPGLSLIIPMYLIIRKLGLLDTLPGLVLPYTALTLPFTIWILRSYFMTLPRELEDAAKVDRCNWFNMMWRVFLPVAAPGLVASAMFSFMASWKEFLFALIFSSSMAAKTVPVIVAEFNDPQVVPRTIMNASGVVAVIPPLLLAVLFQRLIIQGLVAGSVKG